MIRLYCDAGDSETISLQLFGVINREQCCNWGSNTNKTIVKQEVTREVQYNVTTNKYQFTNTKKLKRLSYSDSSLSSLSSLSSSLPSLSSLSSSLESESSSLSSDESSLSS